jgi:hypothetical protein
MSYTYMERRMTEIDAVVEAAEHPSERLRLALTALFLVHRDDRDATLAVSREFVRFIGEPMMAGVRGLRAEYRKAFEAIIADGIQSGEFRKLDTAIVALGLFGMCNWAWTWYHPDGELGAEAVLAVFLQTAMGGILTDSASASSKVPRLPASVREQRENRIRDRGTLLAGLKLS